MYIPSFPSLLHPCSDQTGSLRFAKCKNVVSKNIDNLTIYYNIIYIHEI